MQRRLRVCAILLGLVLLLAVENVPAKTHAAHQTTTATAFVQFTNVTKQAGFPLAKARTRGLAWGDFDNDGWADLYVGRHAYRPDLFKNQRDGTFVNVTDSARVGTLTDRHDCKWGDFNNDRRLDLYCTAGAERGSGSKPNQLWKNNGDGTFQDVAEAMGVVDGPGRGRIVNWFDYNDDGWLDLFLGNKLGNAAASLNRMYRNDVALFTDVAGQAGLETPFSVTVSAVTDFNQDQLWDLSVTSGDNIRLFKKKATGVFRELALDTTGLQAKAVRALAWGDYDNDGYADLYAATQTGTSKLFHNNRNGQFTDVTVASKLQALDQLPANDALWADLNNDGLLDLFIVHRGAHSMPNGPDVLLQNLGDGTFKDVTARAGVAGPTDGQGDAAAVADYDNDGFLDLFVTNGQGAIGRGQLYHNLANQNHWLTIQLFGTHTNSLAIGSKIWLTVNGKTQYREYLYGSAASGQGDIRAHFGLGKATTIEKIKILWSNHQIQELTGISANQHMVIEQP